MISNVNWDLKLSNAAARSMRSIPERDRARINTASNSMKGDPFTGDVAALKQYQGLFRRRFGSWRLIYELDTDQRIVMIHDILRRSSSTY